MEGTTTPNYAVEACAIRNNDCTAGAPSTMSNMRDDRAGNGDSKGDGRARSVRGGAVGVEMSPATAAEDALRAAAPAWSNSCRRGVHGAAKGDNGLASAVAAAVALTLALARAGDGGSGDVGTWSRNNCATGTQCSCTMASGGADTPLPRGPRTGRCASWRPGSAASSPVTQGGNRKKNSGRAAPAASTRGTRPGAGEKG